MNNALVLGLFVTLLGCGSCSRGADVCESLNSIARDGKKVAYAKKWVASRLAEPKFRQSIRTRHVLDSTDERFQEFGEFDWQYFGVDERYAEIVFNMPFAESEGWDATHVHAVTIDWGRSFILFRLGSAADLTVTYSSEDIAKMTLVGNDVYVYCGEGRQVR